MSKRKRTVDDILQQFCSDDQSKYAVDKPWVYGGYKYATNGVVAIRVPCNEPDSELDPPPPPAHKVFVGFDADDSEWTRRESLVIGSLRCTACDESGFEKEVCPNCFDGEIECPHCGNDMECEDCGGRGILGHKGPCPECDGAGWYSGPIPQDIGTQFFFPPVLKRMAMLLPFEYRNPYDIRHGISVRSGQFEAMFMPVDVGTNDRHKIDSAISAWCKE